MHLIMFDLDGTLLRSHTLDIHCFADALSSIMGIENIDSDWTDFKYVTDEGIISEIVARKLNRPATKTEIFNIRAKILEVLESQTRSNREKFAPIPGALDIFCSLKDIKNCGIAIATGCWKESANIKLSTAGFDVSNLPLASSDDSHRREEIMNIAYERALAVWGESEFETVTYVGDGLWDFKASQKMGYHFIGIGFYGTQDQLRQEGAANILNDFSDKKAFFTKMEEIWAGGNSSFFS